MPLRLIWLGVAAMALDIGVSRISYGMLLVPLRADLMLSYTVAGLLSSLNLAAYLAGNLIAPPLGKRWSMPVLACGGHAMVALGALLNGLAQEVFVLAAGRLLMGLGAGVGLVAVFVIAFSRTPTASRGAASAAMWSGIGLALIGTAASFPFTLEAGGAWRWVFIIAAVIGAGVAFGLRPGQTAAAPEANGQSSLAGHQQTRVKSWWQWLPLFGGYGAFGLGYIAYTTFVSVRLANLHLSVAAITASWMVMGLATLAGCGLTAKLLGNVRLKHIAFTLSFVAAAIGCLLVSGEGALLASAAGVFVGLGLASTPAILTAYVRERTSDADYARLFSIGTAFIGTGQLAGPAIAGVLTDRFGSLAVIYLAFAAYALGGLLAALDFALARKHWR